MQMFVLNIVGRTFGARGTHSNCNNCESQELFQNGPSNSRCDSLAHNKPLNNQSIAMRRNKL